jgi:hypothetical protein
MSATLPPQPPGNPPFPQVSAPVQAPAPGMEAVGEEGPLHFTARALAAQLQTVFPPNRFDFQYLDGKLGKTQWGRLTRRPPSVCLGWAGITPLPGNGCVFLGTSHWFVGLLTKNVHSPDARLLGDAVGPGILSMVRAATIALHGFTIDPAETPWAASGTAEITGIHALYNDEFTDEYTTLAGLDVSVQYEEVLPAGLDTINSCNALSVAWTFVAGGANGTWNELIQQVKT